MATARHKRLKKILREQQELKERNERLRRREIERKRSMPPEIKPERDGYRHRLTRKADRILKSAGT